MKGVLKRSLSAALEISGTEWNAPQAIFPASALEEGELTGVSTKWAPERSAPSAALHQLRTNEVGPISVSAFLVLNEFIIYWEKDKFDKVFDW